MAPTPSAAGTGTGGAAPSAHSVYDPLHYFKEYEKKIKSMEKITGTIAHKEESIFRLNTMFADTLQTLGSLETPTLTQHLDEISRLLREREEHRLMQHERFQYVFKPLLSVEMRRDVPKSRQAVQQRERARALKVKAQTAHNKVLNKVPRDRQKQEATARDLAAKEGDVTQCEGTALRNLKEFERGKVRTLKQLLTEHFHAEMAFHARALALNTALIDVVDDISVDEVVHQATQRAAANSSGTLTSTSSVAGANATDVSVADVRRKSGKKKSKGHRGESDDDFTDDDDDDDETDDARRKTSSKRPATTTTTTTKHVTHTDTVEAVDFSDDDL